MCAFFPANATMREMLRERMVEVGGATDSDSIENKLTNISLAMCNIVEDQQCGDNSNNNLSVMQVQVLRFLKNNRQVIESMNARNELWGYWETYQFRRCGFFNFWQTYI